MLSNIVKGDFFKKYMMVRLRWCLSGLYISLQNHCQQRFFNFLISYLWGNFWILPVIGRIVKKHLIKILKIMGKFKIAWFSTNFVWEYSVKSQIYPSVLQNIKINSDLHGKFMHPISSPHWMGVACGHPQGLVRWFFH